MKTALAKLLGARGQDECYLITQAGDEEIDMYSMILRVPARHRAAFLRKLGSQSFAATDFGKVLYYTAGEMPLEEARRRAETLLAAN